MSPVLVAHLAERSEATAIVRAALAVDIVYVGLAEPPPSGRQTLQLFIDRELVASLSAELVGSGRGGEYPLRVGLLHPEDAAALEALTSGSRAPQARPLPSRSPPPNDEAPLAPARIMGADAEDRTLSSRTSPSPSPSPSPSLSSLEPGRESEVMLRPAGLQTLPEDAPPPRGPGASALPPARVPPRSPALFTDEESVTIPGQSTRRPGTIEASWNVRIAPTTNDAMCGQTIASGKYVLDSVIGAGAIGIVFKASHRDLGRTVAIKVLNPRYRDDPHLLDVFRTEARAASQLEHPNVARVYDYGQEPDGLVYIVMEYLSGYTLGSVLGARRKLTLTRAVDVMVQVCAALSAAHDRGIVHRDVKPDNIVLVPVQDDEGHPSETVKVCDFGIAALGATQTSAGRVVGTPEYMAPEQTTGSPVAPSADVYACGIVLYEMLAGEVPFTADQAYRILMKQRHEAPRPPSSLDSTISLAIEGVILRCMEKAPERRYQSARELRVELRRIAPSESKP